MCDVLVASLEITVISVNLDPSAALPEPYLTFIGPSIFLKSYVPAALIFHVVSVEEFQVTPSSSDHSNPVPSASSISIVVASVTINLDSNIGNGSKPVPASVFERILPKAFTATT